MLPESVSIIIPAFNEETVIGDVVRALRERMPNAHIVVVDDGSRDETGQVASRAGADVIAHHRQRGYGAALKTGGSHSSR